MDSHHQVVGSFFIIQNWNGEMYVDTLEYAIYSLIPEVFDIELDKNGNSLLNR